MAKEHKKDKKKTRTKALGLAATAAAAIAPEAAQIVVQKTGETAKATEAPKIQIPRRGGKSIKNPDRFGL